MTFLFPDLASRRFAGAPGQWRLEAGRFAAGILATTMVWLERGRSRRSLAQLDERMLKDLGLSRWDIQQEVEKPFWRG